MYPKNWTDREIEIADRLADVMCEYCNGSGEGYISESMCTSCNSRGTVYSHKRIREIINNGEYHDFI